MAACANLYVSVHALGERELPGLRFPRPRPRPRPCLLGAAPAATSRAGALAAAASRDLRSSPSRVEWRPRELGHDGEDRRGDDRLRRARRRADRPQTRRAGHAAGRRRGRAELCGGRAGTRRVVGQVAQRLASRLHTGGGGGKVSEGAAPRGRRVGARWLHIHLQPELYPRAESIHSQSDAVVAATTTTTSARVPHKATGHTCLDPFRRLIACRRALRRLSRCVARVASATRSIVSFS